MPVPKIKYEKMHLFVFGALLWLIAAYAVVEILIVVIDYLLSLINLFFHN